MNTQKGNGLSSDLLTLGFPLGLSLISNMSNEKNNDFKNKNENKVNKKQSGGMLGNSFIVEAGLSVVPIGLIALNELGKKDDDDISNKK
jgi:hypothetical protein